VNKEKKLAVKIPAGVDEGNKIRLSGEGEAGSRGGQAGDLYVFIAVAKHKFFNRDGDDLYCEVPIRFTSAALGGSIEVPIIDGTKAQLKIPEGTQTAQQFRLKGKGMSVLNSGGRMGDMFVKVFVEVPKKLSAEEKSLLQKLDEVMLKRQSSSKDESIFKKASDFFK
jgi:molecular chaperone DnaJ